MHGGADDAVVDQLVDELMLRLSHVAQLAPDVVGDPAAMAGPLRRTAEGPAAELRSPGPLANALALRVTAALWGTWGDSPPTTWWSTPLGALLAARTSIPLSPVDLVPS